MPDNNVSVVPDPFTDDLFAPLDTRGEGSFEEELQLLADESGVPVSTLVPPIEPEAPAPQPASPADEPKVYEYEDGASVTIEKSSRGWKSTLDSNTGAPPEVFYGETKDEMLLNLAAGKMKATQKIREMNKKIKLGTGAPTAETVSAPTVAAERTLTADEVFEIKTQLDSNPSLAMDSWFQKRTGMTVSELVRLARVGKSASDELVAETIAKEFVGRHPDYVLHDENFTALVAWMCKYKLKQPLHDQDPNSMVPLLFNAGYWVGEVLDEAYDDLANDGLLDLRPDEVPADEVNDAPALLAPPAKPVTPAPPATPNARIAREVRRPRAGRGSLGIRSTESTAVRTDDNPRPPSAEELDDLSNAQVSELLAGVRKLRLGTRR